MVEELSQEKLDWLQEIDEDYLKYGITSVCSSVKTNDYKKLNSKKLDGLNFKKILDYIENDFIKGKRYNPIFFALLNMSNSYMHQKMISPFVSLLNDPFYEDYPIWLKELVKKELDEEEPIEGMGYINELLHEVDCDNYARVIIKKRKIIGFSGSYMYDWEDGIETFKKIVLFCERNNLYFKLSPEFIVDEPGMMRILFIQKEGEK